MTEDESVDYTEMIDDLYVINELVLFDNESLNQELSTNEVFNLSVNINRNKLISDLILEMKVLNRNFNDLLISKGL